jgi:hypothetical protein
MMVKKIVQSRWEKGSDFQGEKEQENISTRTLGSRYVCERVLADTGNIRIQASMGYKGE